MWCGSSACSCARSPASSSSSGMARRSMAIHGGQSIKDYLAHGAAKRLHLERLPGYAPDLNPDEGVWNYLKRVELKNCRRADLAELRLELRRGKERLRHKCRIIRSSSTHCGYSV